MTTNRPTLCAMGRIAPRQTNNREPSNIPEAQEGACDSQRPQGGPQRSHSPGCTAARLSETPGPSQSALADVLACSHSDIASRYKKTQAGQSHLCKITQGRQGEKEPQILTRCSGILSRSAFLLHICLYFLKFLRCTVCITLY